MRLLDLFCGAGGAAMGYHRAGFEVVGVDNRPQKHYPFESHCADAFAFLEKHGPEFDVIHASPPCQAYSEATPMAHRQSSPALIAEIRTALKKVNRFFIIENVENARKHLKNPLMLCGTHFNLPIWRHRYFECNPDLFALLPHCKHERYPITIHSGSHTRKTFTPILCTGGGDGIRSSRKTHRPREAVMAIRYAMEIPWMLQKELTEAIPPAYTEWIGRRLLEALCHQ